MGSRFIKACRLTRHKERGVAGLSATAKAFLWIVSEIYAGNQHFKH